MPELILSLLRPLIRENYILRREGLLPDEWYWADVLALELGADYKYYEGIDA